MIQNAEKFLKKFLKPLVNECTNSIKNTKLFKQKFLEDKKVLENSLKLGRL